jgi:hypothetical protein
MNQARYLWVLVTVIAGVFLFSASALGGDIKARMKARLPAIVQLKAAGIVGETNQGLLAFVGVETQQQDLVAAENEDRKTVYAAIAKRQGTTADVVAKRRALQNAERARPGEWLQDAAGKWYQK